MLKGKFHSMNALGESDDRKYSIEHLNTSFISKTSSYLNTKKKECIKLEERTKMLQNTHDKLRLQINRSKELRDYVINEEQSIMEVYNWYHKLKEELMENYNISIDDVHKFARVIYEFSKSGYDPIPYLKRIF